MPEPLEFPVQWEMKKLTKSRAQVIITIKKKKIKIGERERERVLDEGDDELGEEREGR